MKPQTKQHCKAFSAKFLDTQTHLTAQEQVLIHSGKIDPQQLDHLIPQSVQGAPQDPAEAHLVFKKHHSVNATYLSQVIRDWVETTRHKSPNWEATEDQVKDWREGLTGNPTLKNFSYFFAGPPHLDYNKQAIHILSTSLLQALEAEQYPTNLLEKIPTICELSRSLTT